MALNTALASSLHSAERGISQQALTPPGGGLYKPPSAEVGPDEDDPRT